MVAALCDEDASRHATTSDQDAALLQKPHLLSERALLAAQFRVEKKATLAACARWCRKRLGKAGKSGSGKDGAVLSRV